MLSLGSIILFSEEPQKLSEFYRKILRKDPEWEGGDFAGFRVGGGTLSIGPHSEVKGKNSNPERIMFNLETYDVDEEFERISSLGAKVVQEPYNPDEAGEMTIATFADPDGNFFQLTTPFDISGR